MPTLRLFSPLLLITFAVTAAAAPVDLVTQQLDPRASKVQFRVTSPATSFDGSFSRYQGSLLLDPTDWTKSTVSMSVNLESVQLPPDQLFPALLIQTVLQRLKEKSASFRSTRITPLSKSRYELRGLVRWQGKEKDVTVPVDLVRTSKASTELRYTYRGVLDENAAAKDPVATALGGAGAQGEASSKLVFVAR